MDEYTLPNGIHFIRLWMYLKGMRIIQKLNKFTK